jgi:hypothetical protein
MDSDHMTAWNSGVVDVTSDDMTAMVKTATSWTSTAATSMVINSDIMTIIGGDNMNVKTEAS